MKIDQVLQTTNITTKDNKQLKKTQFLSGGQVYYTFSDVKAGDEREEVGRKEFTKNDGTVETTISFKSNTTGGRGGFGGAKSDPDTMLIAYASQTVVAMINAGLLKDPEDIAKQIRNFATLYLGIFKQHKEGKDILPKKEEPQDDGLEDLSQAIDESGI